MTIEVSDLLTFTEVVACGGFSAAARSRRTTRQAVHREVKRLEESLGVRLLERTTRRVRPTEAGLRLLEHAQRIRTELRAASEAVRSVGARPTGTLRVAAPAFFGEQVLEPVIVAFLQRYPETRVEAIYRLEREDFMRAELDLAIRMGPLPDSSLPVRRLGQVRMVCCAAPSYLEATEAPLRTPLDLVRHSTLHYGDVKRDAAVTWRFEGPADARAVVVTPRLASTSLRVIRRACVDGLGITHLPALAVAELEREGAVVRVLPQALGPSSPVHALMPSRAGNPALRAFLALLVEHLRGATWLDPRAL
ncbi:MAG: LysR family transcriptional regulator [Myxococcales bacterium]|nr:LysR family transcriptional regulator [Myxococcales bacterium]